MCQFVSWVEYKDKIYYLDKHCLLTKEGKELRKYLGDQFSEDIKGHGAIDRYWGLKGKGVHKECTDFSSPKNFPPQIVKALINGDLIGIGLPDINQVLTAEALEQYKKVKAEALEQYKKVEAEALEQYKKVKAPAWEQYKKVEAEAWEQYNKVKAPAWEQYKKVEAEAWEQYNKVKAEALEQYKKVEAEAWEQYKKVTAEAFWKLFLVKKNRVKEWK